MFDDNSFLVNPQLTKNENMKIFPDYKLINKYDTRLIGDEFNIQELWFLSWLGKNEYNHLTYNNSNKSLLLDNFLKKNVKVHCTYVQWNPKWFY